MIGPTQPALDASADGLNPLAISHTDPFWVDLLQGALVLVAVILGQARKRVAAAGRRLPQEPLTASSLGGE